MHFMWKITNFLRRFVFDCTIFKESTKIKRKKTSPELRHLGNQKRSDICSCWVHSPQNASQAKYQPGLYNQLLWDITIIILKYRNNLNNSEIMVVTKPPKTRYFAPLLFRFYAAISLNKQHTWNIFKHLFQTKQARLFNISLNTWIFRPWLLW